MILLPLFGVCRGKKNPSNCGTFDKNVARVLTATALAVKLKSLMVFEKDTVNVMYL